MWLRQLVLLLKKWWSGTKPVTRTGQQAENLAARFLQKRGCQLLARNYRNRVGEIDLIVRDGPYVVFVEVRSRSSCRYGHPVETVDRQKQSRIIRTATQYVHVLRLWDHPTRFDVVTVIWQETGAPPQLEYFADAFRAN